MYPSPKEDLKMTRLRFIPTSASQIATLAMIGAVGFVGCKEKKGSAAPSGSTSEDQFAAPAAEAQKTYPEVEALRTSIPGGQVLLPDDPAFRKGIGWWEPGYSMGEAGWFVTCWTKGEYQMLSWNGPETPGEYDFLMELWRHHPVPTETINIEYVLPGQSEPATKEVPVGLLQITGKVNITEPGQKLHLKMKIPSWIPMEHIPDSTDPRDVGMMFSSIRLTPTAAAAPGEVAVEVPQNTDPPAAE